MTEHHPPHHVCWITPAELATFATSDGDVSFYNAMYCSSLLKAKGIRSAVADGETLPCVGAPLHLQRKSAATCAVFGNGNPKTVAN